jgi:predicted dithiol-disulfide oxidoreductase (DUF899 family)
MIRQKTEWRIEWCNEHDEIFEVDFADNKRQAMLVINRRLDEAHHIDLCKQRSYYDDEDGALIDREYLNYETFEGAIWS